MFLLRNLLKLKAFLTSLPLTPFGFHRVDAIHIRVALHALESGITEQVIDRAGENWNGYGLVGRSSMFPAGIDIWSGHGVC